MSTQEMQPEVEAFAIRKEVSRHCLRGEPYRGFTAIWCGDHSDPSLRFKDADGNKIEVVGTGHPEWRVDAWIQAKSSIDEVFEAKKSVDRPGG